MKAQSIMINPMQRLWSQGLDIAALNASKDNYFNALSYRLARREG
jgi:hypothetical protein